MCHCRHPTAPAGSGPRSAVIWGDQFQRKIIAMQDNLALMLEIDGDAGADDRLDLAQPPVRFDPVAHDGTDFKDCLRHCRDVPDPAPGHQRKCQE